MIKQYILEPLFNFILVLAVAAGLVLNTIAVTGLYLNYKSLNNVSEKELRAVFKKLKLKSGHYYDIGELVIVSSNKEIAYVKNNERKRNVYATTGILKSFKNKHQAALILSHEIGHLALLHDLGAKLPDPRMNEFNADIIGGFIALRAGFDVCKGASYWKERAEKHGETIFTDSHPARLNRQAYLTLPFCEGN